MTCGLTWNEINERGGINSNKYCAYLSLPSSATEIWDFPIEKCIVIKDFEAPVTGVMDYIKPGYVLERGIYTVLINHCDGCGMALPGTLPSANVMIRAPWIKGLLSEFDYIEFCKVHDHKPVLKDFWGKEHDLINEDIRVILTESQFKMAKYYDSWEDYVRKFNECGCHLCCTNYEETWIQNTTLNYQMTQALVDFSDDDIKAYTHQTHNKIKNLNKNKDCMLRTLGADEQSDRSYQAALAIYNELLRDGYARDVLKAIKKRMVLDAKSGAILCNNKRLFAIPDLYAACEFWFLDETEPKGLLPDGYVYSPIYKNEEELDVLRSPSLYMEHAVRKISKDTEVRKWFRTNGIYTSCHDLISRILQFDNDGDQLNCVLESVIIEAAKRNIKQMDIVPLFYDAYKADKEQLSYETLFNGLKRAHDYSGIGQVSNNLTKLWNRENPDIFAAACLTRFNNAVIDAAKCGRIDSYENYPEINKRILKSIGGKRGKMPYWFQFSKNGRREDGLPPEKCALPNNSTMNRICAAFNDVGRLDLRYAGVPPFNYKMLMNESDAGNNKQAVETFINACSEATLCNVIAQKNSDLGERSTLMKTLLVAESIAKKIEEVAPLEEAYGPIVRFLFAGDGVVKRTYKQEFWNVFGDIALERLKNNLKTCTVCEHCGTRLPEWSKKHRCRDRLPDYFECAGCGKMVERLNPRQCRCPECQKEYRRLQVRKNVSKLRKRKAA